MKKEHKFTLGVAAGFVLGEIGHQLSEKGILKRPKPRKCPKGNRHHDAIGLSMMVSGALAGFLGADKAAMLLGSTGTGLFLHHVLLDEGLTIFS